MGPFDRVDSWTGWAYGHPRGETISSLNQHISRMRDPVDRMVAESWVRDDAGGHGVFSPWHITQAIYATGWDGTVVLDANATGTITVVSPAGGAQPDLINLNIASADAIAELPRIGTSKAQAIVDYRSAHGPYPSVEALDNVPGIGPATIEAVRALVTF
jgi:competence ComEA-like helix-hairpin-helix protein